MDVTLKTELIRKFVTAIDGGQPLKPAGAWSDDEIFAAAVATCRVAERRFEQFKRKINVHNPEFLKAENLRRARGQLAQLVADPAVRETCEAIGRRETVQATIVVPLKDNPVT